jgi:hypothetical protein
VEGFEPGSSVPEADAMSTAPRLKGIVIVFFGTLLELCHKQAFSVYKFTTTFRVRFRYNQRVSALHIRNCKG